MTGKLEVPLTVLDNDDPALFHELLGAVEEVAKLAAFTGGRFVERFEAAFAASCKVRCAVGVSSGTEALVMTLRALELGPGDEVLVPANSFVATAEAVCLAGGIPRFADVERDTQLVSTATLERAMTSRLRGIIPVHLFGRTADMPEILDLARSHGVWVVEDCAQAVGARHGGKHVGTFGDAGTFSFYPAKNLGAWGDAGAVITNRRDVAERVTLMRSHGERPRYHHRIVGTTARLDAIQAAVLERKLTRLEKWNRARRALAASLRQALADAPGVTPPLAAMSPADHVYHQFVVCAGKRDALRAHLESRGVASAVHYPVPIHRSPAFRGFAGGNDVAPVATRLSQEIVSLPIFPSMSASQVEWVADAVKSFRRTERRSAAA